MKRAREADQDLLHEAMAIISNAKDWMSQNRPGDTLENVEWRRVARRWLDKYNEQLVEYLKEKESMAKFEWPHVKIEVDDETRDLLEGIRDVGQAVIAVSEPVLAEVAGLLSRYRERQDAKRHSMEAEKARKEKEHRVRYPESDWAGQINNLAAGHGWASFVDPENLHGGGLRVMMTSEMYDQFIRWTEGRDGVINSFTVPSMSAEKLNIDEASSPKDTWRGIRLEAAQNVEKAHATVGQALADQAGVENEIRRRFPEGL